MARDQWTMKWTRVDFALGSLVRPGVEGVLSIWACLLVSSVVLAELEEARDEGPDLIWMGQLQVVAAFPMGWNEAHRFAAPGNRVILDDLRLNCAVRFRETHDVQRQEAAARSAAFAAVL